MTVFSGKQEGDVTANSDLTINGMITGSLTIPSGVKVLLSGMVCENVYLKAGGRLTVRGTVCKNLVNEGGHAEIYGVISGSSIISSGTTIEHRGCIVNSVRK
ncbi:MAG: hypothetical protein GXW94_19625 [Serratia liquefaciens]|nr:hypothetical protein [Serratia liquefaciens]